MKYLLCMTLIICFGALMANPIFANEANEVSEVTKIDNIIEKINNLDSDIKENVIEEVKKEQDMGEVEKSATVMMKLYNETAEPDERFSDEDIEEIAALAQNDADKFTAQMEYKDKAAKENDYSLERTFRENKSIALQINRQGAAVYLANKLKGEAVARSAEFIYKGAIFASYVKTGGKWDLKQKLHTNYTYLWRSSYKTGEYIGNYHYGYQGRNVGFAELTLKTAAGFYQIIEGTTDFSFYKSYFDDPKDQEAIAHGMREYTLNF